MRESIKGLFGSLSMRKAINDSQKEWRKTQSGTVGLVPQLLNTNGSTQIIHEVKELQRYYEDVFQNIMPGVNFEKGALVSVKTDDIAPTKTKKHLVASYKDKEGRLIVALTDNNAVVWSETTGFALDQDFDFKYYDELTENAEQTHDKMKNIGTRSGERFTQFIESKYDGKIYLLERLYIDEDVTIRYDCKNMDNTCGVFIGRINGYHGELTGDVIKNKNLTKSVRVIHAYTHPNQNEAKRKFDEGDPRIIRKCDCISGEITFYIRPEFEVDPKIYFENIIIRKSAVDVAVSQNKSSLKIYAKRMEKLNKEIFPTA